MSEAVPENVAVFDRLAEEYDRWFPENEHAYASELEAVRSFVPQDGAGVEVGAGTGRFAAPLGIPAAVEPAGGMAAIARSRGIEVHEVTAPGPVREGYGEGAFVVLSAPRPERS